MDLKTYLRSGGDSFDSQRLSELADLAGTSSKYLYLIALGHKRAGPALAIAIEKATNGAVGLSDLRSDIWPTAA